MQVAHRDFVQNPKLQPFITLTKRQHVDGRCRQRDPHRRYGIKIRSSETEEGGTRSVCVCKWWLIPDRAQEKDIGAGGYGQDLKASTQSVSTWCVAFE